MRDAENGCAGVPALLLAPDRQLIAEVSRKKNEIGGSLSLRQRDTGRGMIQEIQQFVIQFHHRYGRTNHIE